ncbi:phosphotransferase family protein [Chloroflexota bacterium]
MDSKGLIQTDGGNFKIHRVYGGSNNAIYKIESEQGDFACKLFVEDERQRASREYNTLSFIQAVGFDIAPRPIMIDESKTILPYSIVLYRWTNGKPLSHPINKPQLKSFLDSYHQLHSIHPDTTSISFNLTTAWFHWFNFQKYMDEIKHLYSLYTPWLETGLEDGFEIKNQLERIVESLAQALSETKIDPGQENIHLSLVRVDPNPSNAIVSATNHIHWVDWEYSGWGDPCLDLAELRWHEALQALGDKNLRWLREHYRLSFDDANFWVRLKLWDHILATRWPFLILRVLWSKYHGPDRVRLTVLDKSPEHITQRLKATIQKTQYFISCDE